MQESGSVFSAAVSKMQAGKQLQHVLAERLKMVFHVNYTEEICVIVSYTKGHAQNHQNFKKSQSLVA